MGSLVGRTAVMVVGVNRSVTGRGGVVVVGSQPLVTDLADPAIRFRAVNAAPLEWRADGAAGATERWVCPWQPLPLLGGPPPVAVGPGGGGGAGLALLRADTPVAAGGMLPAYRRGDSYAFENRTEIYVVDLRAATDNTPVETRYFADGTLDYLRLPEYVIAAKAAVHVGWHDQYPDAAGVKRGSLLLWMTSEGTVKFGYSYGDYANNLETAEFTPSLSHHHPTLAVIVTQWAGDELRLWYNGFRTFGPSWMSQLPYSTPRNDFEAMLLGVGDADGNPTAAPVHPLYTANACIREIAVFPDYVMDHAEVQRHTLEYWARYADRAPARVRYHCGPVGAGGRPHVQLSATGQPPVAVADVPGDDARARQVRAWFGEPHPAAMWRRWVTAGAPGGVLWRGAVAGGEPAHLYVPPDAGGAAVLAMLGPAAGNGHVSRLPGVPFDFPNMQPGFGVSLGADLPFTLVNCTAALVLRPGPPAAVPQIWFGKAAHDPLVAGADLRLGAHSVALWQTPAPADELALGVWGPADAADPVAVARVPVAAGQRLAVVVRLDHRVTLVVGGVGAASVPLPPPPGAGVPNPYELVLLGHGNHQGFPAGGATFACRSGQLFEVRLYERELLTDAEVTGLLSELRATYQTA